MSHGEEGTNASSPRHLSRQNSQEGQVIPTINEPPEHTIDCGDIVWSLAFGSSVPEKQSRCVNIGWHRFTFGQDQLLLATGLNNGRIKIWDVYTGKASVFCSSYCGVVLCCFLLVESQNLMTKYLLFCLRLVLCKTLLN